MLCGYTPGRTEGGKVAESNENDQTTLPVCLAGAHSRRCGVVNLSQGQALSPRLRALLQKHHQATNSNRLNQRLEKVASKPPETKMG